MKKSLLFVHPCMGFGGAEKSLQTLLGALDRTQYDADLFLFRREGELLGLLPDDVHLLPPQPTAETFSLPLQSACTSFLKQGRPDLALSRARFSKAVRGNAPMRTLEQRGWKYQKAAFTPLPKQYDAAIAYLEGSPIYFCADLVQAKRRIAYIHNDYRKLQMDASFDEAYLRRFDAIVTVSDACADVLREVFPHLADRVRVVENIISPDVLHAAAQTGTGFDDGYTGLRLLTLGRLEPQKGYDIALDACTRLKDQFDFRWYVLGDGPQKAELDEKICALGLQNRFFLLGTRLNPYPYLADCDIYVQPSRFEGKSIALEEAKAFRKPIVTTAFTTVADQITDGVTGSVAAIDAASIAEKLAQLLSDASLRSKYTDNLQSYTGNAAEIEKFYALLG